MWNVHILLNALVHSQLGTQNNWVIIHDQQSLVLAPTIPCSKNCCNKEMSENTLICASSKMTESVDPCMQLQLQYLTYTYPMLPSSQYFNSSYFHWTMLWQYLLLASITPNTFVNNSHWAIEWAIIAQFVCVPTQTTCGRLHQIMFYLNYFFCYFQLSSCKHGHYALCNICVSTVPLMVSDRMYIIHFVMIGLHSAHVSK